MTNLHDTIDNLLADHGLTAVMRAIRAAHMVSKFSNDFDVARILARDDRALGACIDVIASGLDGVKR